MNSLNFDVTDLLNPVATRFNKSFMAFIDEVKKRIRYLNEEYDSDLCTLEYNKVTGFIEKIALGRVNTDITNIIEFYPHINGEFNLKFLRRKSEIAIFEKDNIDVSIFLFDQFKEGISKVKEFFESNS